MKKLSIIGSGDFAIQIARFATYTKEYKIVGFIDNSPKENIFDGIGTIGNDEDILSLYNNNFFDCLFIGIGYLNFSLREKLFTRFKSIIPFANIIMPDAFVDPTAKLGEGVFIGSRSYIDSNVQIEDNVFIRLDTIIGHDSIIHANSYYSGCDRIAGYCCVGKNVFIGTGVLIADNISIVDNTWIGIGCCVVKDIDKAAKYVSPSSRLIPTPL